MTCMFILNKNGGENMNDTENVTMIDTLERIANALETLASCVEALPATEYRKREMHEFIVGGQIETDQTNYY